jgi:predicted dehydrogenase
VVDVDAAAERFASGQGIPFSKKFDEAIEDKNVQGVVLCTPHTLHAEQIVKAANAKKHVFCEKPLSLTRADAARGIEACRRNGVALAVGHEKRFEPPVQELFRLAQTAIWARCCRWRPTSARTSFSRCRPATGACRARRRRPAP